MFSSLSISQGFVHVLVVSFATILSTTTTTTTTLLGAAATVATTPTAMMTLAVRAVRRLGPRA